MESKLWPIALGLLGLGLLAASVVGVVYVAKLNQAGAPGQAGIAVDWYAMRRFEGRTFETGGVAFQVQRVIYGKDVNPTVRGPVLAACRDEVIFRIKALNTGPDAVTLTPGLFKVIGANAQQNYAQGFTKPVLAPGEERVYHVGFEALTSQLPCVLRVEGDTLRASQAPELASFAGGIDVCPASR